MTHQDFKRILWATDDTLRNSTLRAGAGTDDFGKILDNAMRAIEKDNAKLKGILNNIYVTVALSNV